jgi:hypothetical protein
VREGAAGVGAHVGEAADLGGEGEEIRHQDRGPPGEGVPPPSRTPRRR